MIVSVKHRVSALAYPFGLQVLGRPQRVWLREGLRSSKAPLKLVASGSVVLGNPGRSNTDADLPSSARAVCSGDDWGCYQLAQQNLIHTLGTVEDGCVVILTGCSSLLLPFHAKHEASEVCGIPRTSRQQGCQKQEGEKLSQYLTPQFISHIQATFITQTSRRSNQAPLSPTIDHHRSQSPSTRFNP